MTPHDSPGSPGPFDARTLAERARELTRRDRRADHRLFWLELVVLLVIAALLVARWWWVV
ncbi:hypothetical protein ABII15_04770 [Streptomyces sp. HUAS MG91]|uniref:Uncharacterized protein n=1 Tax=Streptomyces tabacisoli TaxID=3156398 RepID=A0AAU8IM13_9ACTN